MNWKILRLAPWIDTRALFVCGIRRTGSLLDLGSSDGETLAHLAELRPDIKLFAADKGESPSGRVSCEFVSVDFELDPLPWRSASMDAITCMHVVEHLRDLGLLFQEVRRLLKPGGAAYFETPHPKTISLPRVAVSGDVPFTLNFFDDPTHVRPVPVETLLNHALTVGLHPVRSGISRNWLFAAAHPVLQFLPASRKVLTARVHWIGWSSYLIVRRPH